MEVMSLALVAASIAAIILGWKGLNWVWLRPRKLERLLRDQGLCGNYYKLPFGDMIDSFNKRNEARSKPMDFSNDILSRVDPFLHHTIKNHGKNSFIWFGPIPVLMVTQPELIREVFAKIDDFPKPHFSLVEMLIPGLATLSGQKWAKHRKLINPAFHMEKLKIMMPAFSTSCNEMMNIWEKMVSITGSKELDVWQYLVNMTSDVISRAAFSSSYAEGRQAFELIEEQIQIVFNGWKQSFIPGWRYVPTKSNRRFNKIQNEIHTLLRGIIGKRMTEMEAGEATKDDLLGTLMECSFKETQQHRNQDQNYLGMTIDEVIDECKLFYFAGQETTSVLLAFTMILLGRYTDWQARAREEVFNVFGKSIPDFEGLSHLKIVTIILYEVLRLYPPLPSIWRKVETETKLGNLCLPAGVYLNAPQMCSHNDPQHWGEDATEFKPERFSEGISNATKGKNVFFPFGLGPRTCIGQNFALIEAKMALSMILQRFSFQLSPSYSHAPSQIITIRPQFGAQIILHTL